MKNEQHLLDPAFLHRLERMRIASNRLARGRQAGKRRSANIGSSVEFADFRTYAPGDDLRQLDWNAYARTGKLFLKQFFDEQELHISLYLDCSRSMSFGQPSKFSRAQQLAAALGYLSLHHFDYVSVYAFRDRMEQSLPFLHGKGKGAQLLQFLSSLQCGGRGEINRSLRSGAAVHGKPGVSFIFSDFLFADGYEQGISFLQATRQEIVLVHLLAEEELNPALEGALRLVDSETSQAKEITLTPALLREYQSALDQYRSRLAAYANRRGMHYLEIAPVLTLEQIVFHVFKQRGIIR